MEYFEKQDKFKEVMIDVYLQHKIPQEESLRHYFEWKQGLSSSNFQRAEILKMRSFTNKLISHYNEKHPFAWEHKAQDKEEDPFFYLFRGYGEDAEIVGILTAIEEELTNIIILKYGY